MKKFVFSLESLLGLRAWEEQSKRQAMSDATKEVASLEQKAFQAEQKKAALCQDWGASRVESFNRNDRLSLIGALESVSLEASAAQASLGEARERRDQALAELRKAIRNKNTVENLKQRNLEEYRAEMFKQESREIEDIYNARHRARSEL